MKRAELSPPGAASGRGEPAPRVARELFGTTPDGSRIDAFLLTGASGIEVRCLNWGGVLQSIRTPDRHGALADIALGYDTIEEYANDRAYLGAIVGRYANRIARGRFSLDGREFRLPINDPPSHLHGGPGGFHQVLWEAEPFERANGAGVSLSHRSRDGEEGYPGTLDVRVRYTLTNADELTVEYLATTDAATPVSLTQHTYFNLAGAGAGDVLGHELTVRAARFTPVDETQIPTGQLAEVAGTPFDFRTPRMLGERIEQRDEQLSRGEGYDHNYVLDPPDESGLARAARLRDPSSGRVVDVSTTEPGMQLYSGNQLDGTPGKGGLRYERRHGIALETQRFPDSPNQPGFPSAILRPGEKFTSRTIFRFSTDDPTS